MFKRSWVGPGDVSLGTKDATQSDVPRQHCEYYESYLNELLTKGLISLAQRKQLLAATSQSAPDDQKTRISKSVTDDPKVSALKLASESPRIDESPCVENDQASTENRIKDVASGKMPQPESNIIPWDQEQLEIVPPEPRFQPELEGRRSQVTTDERREPSMPEQEAYIQEQEMEERQEPVQTQWEIDETRWKAKIQLEEENKQRLQKRKWGEDTRIKAEKEATMKKIRDQRKTERSLRRMERLREADNEIVNSAIAAVTEEFCNPMSLQTSQGQLAGNGMGATNVPTKSSNAFSMMMKASKEDKNTMPEIKFDDWVVSFEASLELVDYRRVDDRVWANYVTQTLLETVSALIVQRIPRYSCVQTKINAVRAIIEIATSIAYAPDGISSNLVRKGRAPQYLIDTMYGIVVGMSEDEIRLVRREKSFISKIRELRQYPVVNWDGITWNGLDEVLRVLRDKGPIDFRGVLLKMKMDIRNGHLTTGTSVTRTIRKEIFEHITHDSCLETKYNAMNALVDSISVLMRGEYNHIKGCKTTIETTVTTLSQIGNLMTPHESEKVVAELRLDPEICVPLFSIEFESLLIPMYPSVFDYPLLRELRPKLKAVISRKKNIASSDYCESGLLIKLLDLRWLTFPSLNASDACRDSLESLLGIFVDPLYPIAKNEYISKLKSNFKNVEESILRKSVDITIDHIKKRTSRRTPFESRANACNILTKIGLMLIGFQDPKLPFWKTRIFKDHISEDALTDVLRSILHRMDTEERKQLLLDHDWVNELNELNKQRLQITDSMLGLDAIMSIVSDPDDSLAKSSRKRRASIVIDLIEFEPSRLPKVSRNSHAGVRPACKVIDLSDL